MKHHFTRAMAIVLSLMFVLSSFVGLNMAVSAASSQINIQMVDYPRGGGGTVNDWGHPAMRLMNEWSEGSSTYFSAKGDADNNMAVAYCCQPGVSLYSGDTLPSILPADFLDTYNNGALTSTQIQDTIGRILAYGFTGTVSDSMSNADLADMIATQLLIWETIVGERGPSFNHIAPPSGYDAVLSYIPAGHPLRSQILADYNSIVSSVQNQSKIPSFMAGSCIYPHSEFHTCCRSVDGDASVIFCCYVTTVQRDG